MKQSNYTGEYNVTAAESIVAHRFVRADGHYSGAGESYLGVSKSKASSGKRCPLGVLGIGVVESGGIFSKDDPITSDSTGRAVKASDVSVSSELSIDVDTDVDTDVSSEISIDVDTDVDTDVSSEISIDVDTDVSVPSGETPVTSTSAQPTLTVGSVATGTAIYTVTSIATSMASGSAIYTVINTATSTASGSAENTISGGVLPVVINGYAIDDSSEAGKFVRVRLK